MAKLYYRFNQVGSIFFDILTVHVFYIIFGNTRHYLSVFCWTLKKNSFCIQTKVKLGYDLLIMSER